VKDIFVVDKPQGMTSHDVVNFVRKVYNIRKVGHCGTLDPLATGVLVILVGKATRLSSQLVSDDKEYITTMKLGITTDTQDSTGKIMATSKLDGIVGDDIREAILSFKGMQEQVPPMVSAKRHKGRRLYELARKGIEVKRAPHPIEVKGIEVINIQMPYVEFKIVCSKGTYIRTLCHDIGERLRCGAHMTSLRRTRSGNFHIKDALTLEQLHR